MDRDRVELHHRDEQVVVGRPRVRLGVGRVDLVDRLDRDQQQIIDPELLSLLVEGA